MTTAAKETLHDLTPTQEAMLLYALYAPESPAYFEQFCYSYRGVLEVDTLVAACQRAINRHDILRTSFLWNAENQPQQIVHSEAHLPFAFRDLTGLSADEIELRLESLLADDQRRGFDLSQAPLLRLTVVKTGEDEFKIILSNHHLVLDGWSMGILRDEVARTYHALLRRENIDLPAPPNFRDYVDVLERQNYDEAETFWRTELAGFTAPNALVADNAPGRLPAVDEKFEEQSRTLSETLSSRLRASARTHRLTMSTMMQAAWAVLLSLYCNSDEVLFGITVSGRPYDFPDIDIMMGMLINTLPLRVKVSPHELTSAYLQKIQRQVAGLHEFETVPLKQIHEWSALPHHNLPLFESLVVFENFVGHDATFKLQGEMTLEHAHLARTNYPLTIVISPGNEVSVRVVYHDSRFDDAAIDRLLDHYTSILESFAGGMNQPISSINFTTPSEKEMLLTEWSGGGSIASGLKPIHRTIEAQVVRTPDAIAVEHEDRRLTYAELNERANQLAHFLQSKGVRKESLVGICLERSVDLIVAVLAVLKAGGAYVPLDPVYPKDRLELMLADSDAQVLLCRRNHFDQFPGYAGELITIETEAEAINARSTDNLPDIATLENLAYVIYTSGSTGKPKGVMIEHHALASFAAGAADEYEITEKDRVLQFASLCFDASAEEIYCTLSRGATLVLRTEAMITSPKQFLQMSDRLGITVLDLPTGYWHHLSATVNTDDLAIPRSLRLVIIGGEQAKSDHVQRWVIRAENKVRLLNTYGPTEATVVTTTFDLSAYRAGDRIAIGRPLRGLSVYVLDEAMRPVPAGLSGELYIGGAAIARGYLNQPELTEKKFIANPFGEGRLYRSGDVVKFLPDGDLEFLGRVDNQVKIRGFRIELEEIEQAIRNHAAVSEAVVTVHEDSDGDKRLCAYVVLEQPDSITVQELRAFTQSTLPVHMVPGAWTTLESLPLMPNGKVDRRALPAPESERRQVETCFISPRTPTEELLARIWCNVLKLDDVGVNDNFFELGGHSLLAARVFSELQKTIKIELSLVDIFHAPTIAKLAEMIYQRETEAEEADDLMSLLSELDQLSDEQAHHRLAEEITTSPARP